MICLAGQTYIEDGLLILGDQLTLVGPSAGGAKITSQTSILTRGSVTLKGITFDARFVVDGFGSTTTAIGVHFTKALQLQRYTFLQQGSPAGAAAHLDGCDVAGGLTMVDAPAQQSQTGDLSLTLENSYLHDAPAACLGAYLPGSFANLSLDVKNNTILQCDRALDVTVTANGSATTVVTMQLFNNIITKSSSAGVALNVAQAKSGSVVSTGNNALFGNITNYAGSATDGPGYVKSDCLLDAKTPPGLGAGSPCRSAGDPAHGSDHDYFAEPRPSKPDIGAVQMP